ncbi:MAG: hypothetical protein HC853_14005 [Anaerolineae bacterium]|nr:hypothetical protein [Anaerolineae bacterium]
MLAVAAATASGVVAPAAAQTAGGGTWLTALNLSNSGSASQPVVALSADGTSHVMWWDSFDGMRYVSVPPSPDGVAAPTPRRAIVVPGIWNDRQTVQDPRTNRQSVTLSAPRALRLIADPNSRAHAFWPNVNSQLLYATTGGNNAWTQPAALADSASAMDVTADPSSTLHLVFVRPTLSPNAPPGLYYRAAAGPVGHPLRWSIPTPTFASTSHKM